VYGWADGWVWGFLGAMWGGAGRGFTARYSAYRQGI
jgi:hypothetical protein